MTTQPTPTTPMPQTVRHHIKKWIDDNLLNGSTHSIFIETLNSEPEARDKLSAKLAEVLFRNLEVCTDAGHVFDAILRVSPVPGWIKRPAEKTQLCYEYDMPLESEEKLLHAFEKDGGLDYRSMMIRFYSNDEDNREYLVSQLIETSKETSRDGVADDVLRFFPEETHATLGPMIDEQYDDYILELRASATESCYPLVP